MTSWVAEDFYQNLLDKGYQVGLCHFSNPNQVLDNPDPYDKIFTYPLIMYDMPVQSKSKNPLVLISCYKTPQECQSMFKLAKAHGKSFFIRIFDNQANSDISELVCQKTNINPPF